MWPFDLPIQKNTDDPDRAPTERLEKKGLKRDEDENWVNPNKKFTQQSPAWPQHPSTQAGLSQNPWNGWGPLAQSKHQVFISAGSVSPCVRQINHSKPAFVTPICICCCVHMQTTKRPGSAPSAEREAVFHVGTLLSCGNSLCCDRGKWISQHLPFLNPVWCNWSPSNPRPFSTCSGLTQLDPRAADEREGLWSHPAPDCRLWLLESWLTFPLIVMKDHFDFLGAFMMCLIRLRE